MSRTERDTTSSSVSPERASPISGPCEVRWRVGFSPTRPLWLAGIRIEPPPSLAWATGTIPAATAAPGTPAGAARRVLEVPGVAGCAVGDRLGRRQDAEFGHIGLADGDEACVAEARTENGVDGQTEVGLLQGAHAQVGGLAGEPGAEVLEQEGHAAEGPVGQLARGLLARLVVEPMDDRVDLGVDALGALDRGLDQLRGRGLAAADQLGLRGRVHLGQLVLAHRSPLPAERAL